jgi:hypothetical protein
MTEHNDIRDKIVFILRTEEMVTNLTVKVIATIHAAITPKTNDSFLQSHIRDLMEALIPDAKWQFSNMVRAVHPSGMETVQLTAMARVKEADAAHLEERAQQVKVQSEGCSFNISKIQTDNSFPTSLVDEIESRMRLALLLKARTECDLINAALASPSERAYHVSLVSFENNDQHQMLSHASTRNFSSGGSNKTPYGTSFDDDNALGNTQKVQMVADVTLARRF